jgi:hypothetical protein
MITGYRSQSVPKLETFVLERHFAAFFVDVIVESRNFLFRKPEVITNLKCLPHFLAFLHDSGTMAYPVITNG